MTPEALMRQAITEGSRGGRNVRPNPRVGAALLTTAGQVVVDYHKQVGQPHAEREVLARARAQGLDVKGATLAVTLEPCAHHGRTPPCTEALIAAQLAKVYVGSRDPHPLVAGRGIDQLREAGIEVSENILRSECESLNTEWLQAYRQGFPFVRLKMATSLDGQWTAADGKSQWITGATARNRGHVLRAEADALITGAGTVTRDRPAFTARLENGGLYEAARQPYVFVLSRQHQVVLADTPLAAHPNGAEAVLLADGNLRLFLEKLLARGFTQVLVEAGPSLSTAFLAQALVNEIELFVGGRLLGGTGMRLGELAAGHLPGLELKLLSCSQLSDGDLHLRYKLLSPGSPAASG